MALSNRERQFISRLAGHATNPVKVRVRTHSTTKARNVLGWKATVALPRPGGEMVDNDLAQQRLVAGP